MAAKKDTAAAAEQTASLREIEVESYLKECVEMDPLALDEEFCRMGSDLAYWGERYADAIKRYLRAKLAAEKVSARALLDAKAQALAAGEKVTVDEIKARALLDERADAADVALVEADAERQRLRLRCDAVMAKKDMLQSLGAKVRAEMQDPSVREQFAGARLAGRR